MQVNISGKQIETGESLRQYVEAEILNEVKKYFDHPVAADVVFSKERHLFQCNIIINEGTGNHVMIKASAKESEIYAAFDNALERAAKQLRRYKRRIRDHHKKQPKAIEGVKYILSDYVEDENTSHETEYAPLVIAEKPSAIEELSVSDAVMKMDLSELPALLFINSKTGSVNVVYRRTDGNISWVDSGLKQAMVG